MVGVAPEDSPGILPRTFQQLIAGAGSSGDDEDILSTRGVRILASSGIQSQQRLQV